MPSASALINAAFGFARFSMQYLMYLTQLGRRQHEFRNS